MAEIDNKHEVNDSIDMSIKTDNEISTSLINVGEGSSDGLTKSLTEIEWVPHGDISSH